MNPLFIFTLKALPKVNANFYRVVIPLDCEQDSMKTSQTIYETGEVQAKQNL